jgi:hypothetical protein
LDSSCALLPQQDVEQIVTAVEGNTSLEKHNGVCTEEVCNREGDTEVPTKYQVSSSQEHVTLLMDQMSSIKYPFNLDDTRSEDLFELSSGSYNFEEPNVVESKQRFESTTQTVSSVASVADRQHCLIPGDNSEFSLSIHVFLVQDGDYYFFCSTSNVPVRWSSESSKQHFIGHICTIFSSSSLTQFGYWVGKTNSKTGNQQ